MKPLEEVTLVYTIALELQKRMTFSEINIYLLNYLKQDKKDTNE